jgi:3-mercaptopropionate dioxygenase
MTVVTQEIGIEEHVESSLQLGRLVDALRSRLAQSTDPVERARRAADCLRAYQPDLDVLSPEQQRGSPEHYQQHILHVDREQSFSVLALVWLAGQRTAIHDHLCWGAVAVLRGIEQETLYSLVGDRLVAQVRRLNPCGDVSSFAPPGDIHYVCNPGPETTISLHVYGTDIALHGSSIRRTYSL